MAIAVTTYPQLDDFIRQVLGVDDVGKAWLAGFESVSAGANWKGGFGTAWMQRRGLSLTAADLYFCISVLAPGSVTRSLGAVVAQPCLIVDDIGTKIDRAKWEALFDLGFPRPTFREETSPGNETMGWALAGDASSDQRVSDMLQIRANISHLGLSDEVLDTTRYVRLPCGHNSKPKYSAGGVLPAPQVRLLEWNAPDVVGLVDIEVIGAMLCGGGANWRASPWPTSAGAQALLAGGGSASGTVRSADLARAEPIMLLAQDLGKNLVQVRPGVVEAFCPNMAEHGAGAETGFAFLGNGVMKCQHAHCAHLSTANFRAMLIDEYDLRQCDRLINGLAGPDEPDSAAEFLAVVSFGRGTTASEDADVARLVAASMVRAAADAQVAGASAAAAVAVVGASVAAVVASRVTSAGAVLPPRKWLYGRAAIQGFISFLVAPGGVGKSALAMVEAVAIASGRELLGGDKPVEAMTVWVHNAEDDMNEMRRRLAAVLQHYGMSYADLLGNLIMTSGRDWDLQLARMGQGGAEVIPGVVDAIAAKMLSENVKVLILDPLGAMHTLPENSNEAANTLLGGLRAIADRAELSIVILHHAGKQAATDMDAAGAGAARGASAYVDGARVVRQLVRMTGPEAAKYGVAEADRRNFLRVENGKANLAVAENARWLRMADVALGNGMGLWPLGDRVGVVERWTAPISLPGTAGDLALVQDAITLKGLNLPRESHLSPDWVGWVVAGALGLDAGWGVAVKDKSASQAAAFARVRGMVRDWLASGGLVEVPGINPTNRKSARCVGVGQPAILLGGAPEDEA